MFDLEIIKCEPKDAIGIVDADVRIEFLPPKDYEKVCAAKKAEAAAKKPPERLNFAKAPGEDAKMNKSAAPLVTADKVAAAAASVDPRKNKLTFAVFSLILTHENIAGKQRIRSYRKWICSIS